MPVNSRPFDVITFGETMLRLAPPGYGRTGRSDDAGCSRRRFGIKHSSRAGAAWTARGVVEQTAGQRARSAHRKRGAALGRRRIGRPVGQKGGGQSGIVFSGIWRPPAQRGSHLRPRWFVHQSNPTSRFRSGNIAVRAPAASDRHHARIKRRLRRSRRISNAAGESGKRRDFF